ncbi:hypothetical protein Bbelb_397040 [Branchiostoma belcheri]|nr:hypothetical protein Bbelb_397040 [Branchiostoma belcheri]
MQQGPRQFRFELGKRPRLRRTGLKFIPFPDGAGEEREPVEVGSARDGLQCLSVIDATGASSHRDNPALLKLRKRVRFTPYIRPVCLPDSTTVVQPGTVCTITGWGTTSEGGSLSDQLQEADVPIVSNADCSSSYTGLLDLDSEICAGYMAGGVDSCQGDSGGPLVWLTEGQHLLIGLTSWGEGCARPNRPGVYTRVTSVVNWIKRIIHINS